MVSRRPSADFVGLALLWISVAVAAFVVFRVMLPPRPASAPLAAAVGFMLVTTLLYAMRERIFVRSAVFAFAGAAAYLFAWHRETPSLYAFSAVCFAVVAVSHLLPRWALRRIEATMETAAWIPQGDSATLRVIVSNASTSAARMLELDVPLDGVIEGSGRARALLVQLRPGESRHLALRTPGLRRGRRKAGALAVRSGFPLGLAFAEELTRCEAQFWVYPRVFAIGFLPVAGGQFLDMGDAISPRAGGVEEFAGVREYRHGDSRRHVHWRASARRGELVVKEFTRRNAATVTIALDLAKASCWGEGIETTTEYAISVAASAARYALESGHYVQIVLCGAKFEVLGPLRGAYRIEDILRTLAEAQADGSESLGEHVARIAARTPPESTLVLVYADASTDHIDGFLALDRRGIVVVPIVIDAGSFGAPAPAGAQPAVGRKRERRIRRGDDPSEVFRP